MATGASAIRFRLDLARRCARLRYARARPMKLRHRCRRAWARSCFNALQVQLAAVSGARSRGRHRAGAARAEARYRRALVVALDLAPGMLREMRQHQRLFRRFERVCADAMRLPLADCQRRCRVQQSDVAVVRSAGPGVGRDPPRAQTRRLLCVQHFRSRHAARNSRSAWAAARTITTMSTTSWTCTRWVTALVRAGLTEPVLDVDRLCLTYPDTLALMRDLKAIGAHNVTAGRPRGLTGRGAHAAHADRLRSVSRRRATAGDVRSHLRGRVGRGGARRDPGLRGEVAHRARSDQAARSR